MSENRRRFEVLSVGEMRKKYYGIDETPPAIHLDPDKVPDPLRTLIPLAEKWGISDDMFRMDAVEKASSDELAELKRMVVSHEDLLLAWLTGPESQREKLTPEFLAFTNMLMASLGC